ncbi:hypothetical protein [Rhizobium leguminosarum]|uniref:hypothetical protein n=1 Tax=Rhizobium leguminosarum TaxID=384 RepID=UPI003D057C4D
MNLLTYLESQVRNSEQPRVDLGILNAIAAESWLSRREPIYGTSVLHGTKMNTPIAERSGLPGLNDGQKISFETTQDRRSGKTAAEVLRAL